jgi:starvation-inducible outer membrane lipoprotein
MPYYMGDYYAGDYYGGDPFWGALARLGGSLIGKVFRRGGRRVAPLALPVAAGVASTAIEKIGSAAGGMVRRGTQAIIKHPVISAAAAAGVVGAIAGREEGMMGMTPHAMKGFHMSKFRKGHPQRMVHNRHMRVTNPKALRRALRRAHGFAKLAMRTIHLVHPQKKGKFGGFKKKRAR